MSDDPYLDTRNPCYLDRLVRGQIADISEDIGRLSINIIDSSPGYEQVTVPTLWFSANAKNDVDGNPIVGSLKTAWGRYMPLGSEIVDIAYRNDCTAAIVGYNATADENRSTGWSVLKKLQENNVSGYSSFKQLKRGEFDFKSSGDAYIYGSAGGTLLLAGGVATIKLDKQSYRITTTSSEIHNITGGGTTELRLGTVFRLTPPNIVESPQSVVPLAPPYLEFMVDVNNPIAGYKSPQSRAKLHFGDILLPIVNTPEFSLKTGLPLRGKISIGDAADALEVFGLQIDNTGNVIWLQSQTGILAGLDMTMFQWKALTTTNIDFTAGAKFSITSPMILLGGVTAIHPLILSTPYRAAEDVLFNSLQAYLIAIATAFTTAGSDSVLAALCSQAAGAFAGAGAALSAAVPVSFTTFTVASPSYLSLVSKTV